MKLGLGKAFNRLWVATGFSNLADGLVFVGLMLAAARVTDSVTLVAGVSVASRLPQVLVTLHAGAIADRVDRRRLMAGMNIIRLLSVGVTALLAQTVGLTIVVLYILAFVLGAAEVFVDTASQSAVPMVVEREQLAAANGRIFGTQRATNDFVGAPLGGVLVAIALAFAFSMSAMLYGFAAVALLSMPGTYRPTRPEKATMRADILEGLRFVVGHRLLRTFAFMAAASNMASAGFFAVFVLFVVGPGSPMELSESSYGFLMASVAAGAVVGSVVTGWAQQRVGRIGVLRVAVVVVAACYAVPVFTSHVVPVATALFISGLVVMIAAVMLVSLRQLIVPEALLGRSNATLRLLSVGTVPLGAALAGAVGDWLGLRAVFAGAASLTLLATLGFFVLTEERLDQAQSEAEPPDSETS